MKDFTNPIYSIFGGRKNFNGGLGATLVFILALVVLWKYELTYEQLMELLPWVLGSVAGLLGVTNYALAKSDEGDTYIMPSDQQVVAEEKKKK